MISLVAPALRARIQKEFGIENERIFFRPSFGSTPLSEAGSFSGELKLPCIAFWRHQFIRLPVQGPKGRSGFQYEGVGDLPAMLRSIRMIPCALVFDINIYGSNTPFIDNMLRRYVLWETPPEGQRSSLYITIPVEGRDDPIVVQNHLTFSDPIDNSDIDFGTKGILYHWLLQVTVKTWIIDDFEVRSVLKLDTDLHRLADDGNAAQLLDHREIRPLP